VAGSDVSSPVESGGRTFDGATGSIDLRDVEVAYSKASKPSPVGMQERSYIKSTAMSAGGRNAKASSMPQKCLTSEFS